MNYTLIKPVSIADGAGVRVSLFVSGCRRHCEDCFNPETWDFDNGSPYDKKTEEKIIKLLAPKYIAGLTILGGEPFEPENVPTVKHIIESVKSEYPEKDIWVYTGFTIEQLKQKSDPNIDTIFSLIDRLVDGPFMKDKKNPSLAFRGSENQRIIDMKTGDTTDYGLTYDPYKEK